MEYDKDYPELIYVRMIHNGQTVDFDHTRVKTSTKSYSYNPEADIFSLIATFEENKDNVKSLDFHILNNDGTERTESTHPRATAGSPQSTIPTPTAYPST